MRVRGGRRPTSLLPTHARSARGQASGAPPRMGGRPHRLVGKADGIDARTGGGRRLPDTSVPLAQGLTIESVLGQHVKAISEPRPLRDCKDLGGHRAGPLPPRCWDNTGVFRANLALSHHVSSAPSLPHPCFLRSSPLVRTALACARRVLLVPSLPPPTLALACTPHSWRLELRPNQDKLRPPQDNPPQTRSPQANPNQPKPYPGQPRRPRSAHATPGPGQAKSRVSATLSSGEQTPEFQGREAEGPAQSSPVPGL